MYNQFGKKTNLIEKKRSEGRSNDNDNPLVVSEDLDSAALFFFSLFNSANLASYSFNFLSIIA